MRTRPDDWPEQLAAHIDEWRRKPFIWGATDCGHFAASWMERLGYVKPLAGLPGWTSPLSAYRMFRKLESFEHIVQAQMRALGCDELDPRHGGRGNVAQKVDDSKVLGIITSRGVAFRTREGLSEYPLYPYVSRIWRV